MMKEPPLNILWGIRRDARKGVWPVLSHPEVQRLGWRGFLHHVTGQKIFISGDFSLLLSFDGSKRKKKLKYDVIPTYIKLNNKNRWF